MTYYFLLDSENKMRPVQHMHTDRATKMAKIMIPQPMPIDVAAEFAILLLCVGCFFLNLFWRQKNEQKHK